MTAPLTIDARERVVLHGLMSRRFLILAEEPSALATAEDITAEQLCERLSGDLRLMEEIGWAAEDDREEFELTMPRERLVATLRRLRDEARRAQFARRHEREPQGDAPQRRRRFREATEVCDELLARIESQAAEEEDEGLPLAPICGVSSERTRSHELTAYAPVTDGFILAALERAELHEQEEAVMTYVLTEHLGFESVPSNNQHLWPRYDELRQAGLVTTTEPRGEPLWSLTAVGRERLASDRGAGEIGELPESPQHRAWRHARVEAALRVDVFRDELTTAVQCGYDLLYQSQPVSSEEWFELSERLRWDAWRLGSATYCLTEWPEPGDAMPDPDENPGPRPGRRATSAWNRNTDSQEGP